MYFSAHNHPECPFELSEQQLCEVLILPAGMLAQCTKHPPPPLDDERLLQTKQSLQKRLVMMEFK